MIYQYPICTCISLTCVLAFCTALKLHCSAIQPVCGMLHQIPARMAVSASEGSRLRCSK